MHTDKRPTSGSGREDEHSARDAYDDERDQAIDADPQLREIGRARLRKRADRASRGERGGGAGR